MIKKSLSSHEADKFLFRLRTASWAKSFVINLLFWKFFCVTFSWYQSFHNHLTHHFTYFTVISLSFHSHLIFVCFSISCSLFRFVSLFLCSLFALWTRPPEDWWMTIRLKMSKLKFDVLYWYFVRFVRYISKNLEN